MTHDTTDPASGAWASMWFGWTFSKVASLVLLQSSFEGEDALVSVCSQAATSNSTFTKATGATMSSPPIPFTCPFLIIAKVS